MNSYYTWFEKVSEAWDDWAANRIDDELDAIYAKFDALIKDGDLEACNREMAACIGRTDIDILIGYLCATLPVHSKIDVWQVVANAAFDQVVATTTLETAKSLFHGLPIER